MAFPPPAYTAVSSRQTLGVPQTATVKTSYTTVGPAFAAPQSQLVPPAQNSTPARKIVWPPEVREYVQRSFAPEALVNGIKHKEIEAKLKEVITEIAESNRLYSVDWKSFPLPAQLILQERARAAETSPHTYWAQQAAPTNSYSVSPGADASTKKRPLEDDLPRNAPTPPWRKSSKSLEDRITYSSKQQEDRMEKRQRKIQADNADSSKFEQDLERRRQRFELDKKNNSASPRPWSRNRDDTHDSPSGPVIGTCQRLEKNYFRLTSAPKPEEVRPLPVLEKTLDLLKSKWKKEGNYAYICDQFKSLRQDLTVQHIKNSFTVDVYELHARIALEKGDLGEYNQCQTQLRGLYSLNLGGHPAEFLAYRILYFIHTCNRTGLNDLIADLTPADKEKPEVKHALAMRSALALGNYHRFFRLYLDVPNMGAYLMDMFVVRERLGALCNMCKAYKPKISIRFLTEELGFESHHETALFIVDHGAQTALEEHVDDHATDLLLNPGAALPIFETAKLAAFQKVDIKGQI